MRTEYDYIVLGLGGIGSAAAYWLARQAGPGVLGIEQFELGHVRGGSQDHSRIIRLSYHTPAYVELAKEAYAAWHEVEVELGESLILKTGGLDLGPLAGAIDLADYAASLTATSVAYETLTAAEIMQRWPQFRLDEDVHGLYQADAGIVPAARCNAAHQRLAQAHGAFLLDRTPVLGIYPTGGEIEILTERQTFRCGYLVIASGAWTNTHLRHFGLQLPLTVTQEQVTYFATPHLADFAPERFPVWIWMDEPSYYGFPVFGEAATKVAQDVGGAEVTAATRSFEPDAAAAARVADFTGRILPDAVGPVLYHKTCLYTLTPDRDFVVDAIPGHANVAVAVGAGHAFKFASVIGRLLSGLVGGTGPEIDLAPFALDRSILREVYPAKDFMV